MNGSTACKELQSVKFTAVCNGRGQSSAGSLAAARAMRDSQPHNSLQLTGRICIVPLFARSRAPPASRSARICCSICNGEVDSLTEVNLALK